MIARKPKTAVFTMIVLILVGVLAAGCAFTGAKETPPEERILQKCFLKMLAEVAGFEPANRYLRSTVFGAASLSHSDTLPRLKVTATQRNYKFF